MRLQSKREAADKKKPSDAFGKHVSVFGWFRDQGISSLSLYVCTYLQPSLPHSPSHSHKLYTSAIRVFSSLSSNKAKNAAATGSLIHIQYFILFFEKRISSFVPHVCLCIDVSLESATALNTGSTTLGIIKLFCVCLCVCLTL